MSVWEGRGFREVDQAPKPEVTIGSMDDVRFWFNVLHRRTCDDAARMSRIEARLRNLERPWWKKLWEVDRERV